LKERDGQSRLTAIVYWQRMLIILCALVATVILTSTNTQAAKTHSRQGTQLSTHSLYAPESIFKFKTDDVCSQHLIGNRSSWQEWSTFIHLGLNDFVEPQQINTTEKHFDRNTLYENEIVLSGNNGVARRTLSGLTYSISATDSLTIYLPFVARNYTHPLLNGDFEMIVDDFAAYWKREGGLSVTIDICSLENHCILLGSPDYPCNNVPLGYGQVSQTFGVPRTGTPMLSFYYRIFSYDELDDGIYDSFDVYIDNVLDGTPPILILRDGSTDGRYGCNAGDLDIMNWKKSPEFDLSAIPDGSGGTVDYRGKTVQLSFYVYSREPPPRTVGWYNTWVYLDNVKVK
jgi:hypothetical protein